MEKEQLTITTALKFARHDFLNKLQIVLMHIDLDSVQDARKTILNVTDEMRELSSLELLGLPKTAEWLLTFGWVYPAYQKTLTCSNKLGVRTANDAEVAVYLEQVFSDVEQLLDPAYEYEALIDVSSSPTDWSIKITIIGALLGRYQVLENGDSFVVEETISHNLWTFTLSGH